MKDYYWCTTWLGAAKARLATVNAVNAAQEIEGHNVYPISGDDIARLQRVPPTRTKKTSARELRQGRSSTGP